MVQKFQQMASDVIHNSPGWSTGSVLAALGGAVGGWFLGDMIGGMLGFEGMGAQLISALFVGAASGMVAGPVIDGWMRQHGAEPSPKTPVFPDTTAPGRQPALTAAANRGAGKGDLAALASQFQQERAGGAVPASDRNHLPHSPSATPRSPA